MLSVKCLSEQEIFVWAIVGMLNRFTDDMVSDKDMYTSAEAVRDVSLVLRRADKCRGCQGCESGVEKS